MTITDSACISMSKTKTPPLDVSTEATLRKSQSDAYLTCLLQPEEFQRRADFGAIGGQTVPCMVSLRKLRVRMRRPKEPAAL